MFSRTSVVDSGRGNSALWAPAFILIVGVASLVLLITTDWIRERLVAVEMVRLNTLVELQLAASTVHLWLEEYVSGDEVDLTEISRGLERATILCETLVGGGRIAEFNIDLPPLPSGPALVSALQVRDHLETFSALTNSRRAAVQRNENAGIGSPMDDEYDSSYGTFLTATKSVESAIRNRLAERTRLAHALYLSILLSWTAIILLAVTGLWTHERHRREAEEALRRKEAQLAQARKLDAVGRLAAGITHDINNYVAAINTNCELLKMNAGSDSAVTKKTDTVLAVTGKISALIERLLAFSSRQPRHRKTVDLNVLITNFKTMLRAVTGKDVQLTLDLQDGLWTIWMDPGQIERIVMNLAVNAGQAMPTGGRIVIATQNLVVDDSYPSDIGSLEHGDYVVLEFSDNGPGLPKEIQQNVFEPFFTTKDSTKNHGLGLATVYGIVQQNNGYISLYSEPGHGATFKIYFPRHIESAQDHPMAAHTPVGAQARSKVVLLVEDDDEFRKSIAHLLANLGYTVIAEENAESAIQSYQDRAPDIDLMITDVVMPGTNGPELACMVHSFDADIPVVFMSGHAAETLLEQGLVDQQLVDQRSSFLRKPFSAGELSAKIDAALSTGALS